MPSIESRASSCVKEPVSQPGPQSAHCPLTTSPVLSSTLLAHHGDVESSLVHFLWVVPLYLNGKTQSFPFTDLHSGRV